MAQLRTASWARVPWMTSSTCPPNSASRPVPGRPGCPLPPPPARAQCPPCHPRVRAAATAPPRRERPELGSAGSCPTQGLGSPGSREHQGLGASIVGLNAAGMGHSHGGGSVGCEPSPRQPPGAVPGEGNLGEPRGTLVCQGELWCAEGSLGVPLGLCFALGHPVLPPNTAPPPTSSPLGLSLGAEPPLEWCWLEVSVAVLVPRPCVRAQGRGSSTGGSARWLGGAAGARGSRVPGP